MIVSSGSRQSRGNVRTSSGNQTWHVEPAPLLSSTTWRRHRLLQLSAWGACEALERRVLMSTVQWVSTANGSWEDPANWLDTGTSQHRVPNSGDDVVIDAAGATPTVTINNNE